MAFKQSEAENGSIEVWWYRYDQGVLVDFKRAT